MYFSTLCSLRSFAVDFLARGLHTCTAVCHALTLALARLSCLHSVSVGLLYKQLSAEAAVALSQLMNYLSVVDVEQ